MIEGWSRGHDEALVAGKAEAAAAVAAAARTFCYFRPGQNLICHR